MTIIGAFIRVYGLGDWYYYFDEMWHVYVAKSTTVQGVYYTNLTEDGHPILPYLVWHYLLGIWDSTWSSRMPSLVFGILSIPMAYFTGKEIFKSESGAIFTSFFIAFSRLSVEQSQVVRGYSMMLFFSLLAIFLCCKYLKKFKLKYLLLYFICLAIALFCEFAAAPIALICNLALAYKMYYNKQCRVKHGIIYILCNLVILSGIAIFTYQLKTIGHVNFSDAENFLSKYNDSLFFAIGRYCIFFLDFFLNCNVVPAIINGIELGTFDSLHFLFLMITAMMGFSYMINHKKFLHLYIVLFYSAVVILFDKLALIPVDFPRRNMGFLLAMIMIFYYGFCYYCELLRLKKIKYEIIAIIIFSLAIFTLNLKFYHNWREGSIFEFQLTKKQNEDSYNYLDSNVRHGDIIITDWLTYILMQERFGGERAKDISPNIQLYSGYKIPVYILKLDYRSDSFILNLADLQTMVRQLNERKSLGNNVWLTSIQMIDVKSSVISGVFSRDLLMLYSNKDLKYFESKVNLSLKQQSEFSSWLEDNVDNKFIIEQNCKKNRFIDNNETANEKCPVKSAILGLTSKKLSEKLLNYTDLLDPRDLMHELRAKVAGKNK